MTEDSSLLAGLDADALYACAQAYRPQAVAVGAWEPPGVDWLAVQFPGWEIVRLIGRGGMAAVYEVRQPELSRSVAVKVLPVELGGDAAFAERFRREARTLAQMRHHGIVAIYDAGTTPAGHLYFVMELVEGEDLARRMLRGRVEPEEAFRLLDEICAALAFAHREGFTHRDVKPSNVLLTLDGRVKVADFGLAGLTGPEPDSKLTANGMALGTFDYAAPEQAAGLGMVDARADIYSVGVLAYELLTGRVPRGVFDPPSHLNAQVDPAVDAVILTALQSDPARRYAGAGAFSEALGRARDARANQLAREQGIRRQLLRRARLAGAFGLLSALVAGAGGYGWWQQRKAREQTARADVSRNRAEQLIAFLTEQFVDKLKETGRNELLEDAVEQAERYFASLPPEEAGPSSLARQARVQLQRAYVHRTKGEWEAALASARAAGALADRLAAEQRDDAERALLTLHTRHFTGSVLMIRGEYTDALVSRRDLRERATQALRGFPDNSGIAVRLANAWRSEGETLFNLQRYDEARSCQAEAERIAAEFLAGHPDHAAMRAELAAVCQERGSLAEKADADYPAALNWFQKAVELYGGLVKPGEWSFDHRYNLCGSLARVATIHLWRQEPEAAMIVLREAISIVEQLEARTPGGTPALYQRRFTYLLLSKALEARGMKSEAAAAQEQSAAAGARIEELLAPAGM